MGILTMVTGEMQKRREKANSFTPTAIGSKASGFGVFVYANGNRYEGQWLDDKRHGRGQFVCAEDKCVYDGEFAFGRKEGRGVYKMPNGQILSGIWKQGELAQVSEFIFAPDSPWKNPDL